MNNNDKIKVLVQTTPEKQNKVESSLSNNDKESYTNIILIIFALFLMSLILIPLKFYTTNHVFVNEQNEEAFSALDAAKRLHNVFDDFNLYFENIESLCNNYDLYSIMESNRLMDDTTLDIWSHFDFEMSKAYINLYHARLFEYGIKCHEESDLELLMRQIRGLKFCIDG